MSSGIVLGLGGVVVVAVFGAVVVAAAEAAPPAGLGGSSQAARAVAARAHASRSEGGNLAAEHTRSARHGRARPSAAGVPRLARVRGTNGQARSTRSRRGDKRTGAGHAEPARVQTDRRGARG